MNRTFVTLALAVFALADAGPASAGESYEGSFSASFPSQTQSCAAAQNQAERVVRDHFRRETAAGATVSIAGKRCECARNTRYATPLFDCMGYATGTLEERAPFDDGSCVSILTSGTGQATWTMRMSRYLLCVRRLPDYNRSWEPAAMDRVRQQQQAEGN